MLSNPSRRGGPALGCVPFLVPEKFGRPFECSCYSPHLAPRNRDCSRGVTFHSPSYINVTLFSRWFNALKLFLNNSVVNVGHLFAIGVGYGMLDVADWLVTTLTLPTDRKNFVVVAVESGNVEALDYVLKKAGLRTINWKDPELQFPWSAKWSGLGKPDIIRRLLDAGWRCEADGSAVGAAFYLREWHSINMLVSSNFRFYALSMWHAAHSYSHHPR